MPTIVSLHAHPDDEALLTGGWLRQRAEAGDRVVLVFATDGGAGLADRRLLADLGGRRRAEAAEAAALLGVARVVWLGYADSGMAGRPSQAAERFADQPVERAAEVVAEILDEERAAVLTGYDANGGYGHPDHVQVHRVARAAQARAANRPLLLEATRDRTWLVRLSRVLRPVSRLLPGLTIPGDRVYADRSEITTSVDVCPQLAAKRAALAAHDSQGRGGLRTLAVLRVLPGLAARRVLGTEQFIEVW